jgi:hypothetical protein
MTPRKDFHPLQAEEIDEKRHSPPLRSAVDLASLASPEISPAHQEYVENLAT